MEQERVISVQRSNLLAVLGGFITLFSPFLSWVTVSMWQDSTSSYWTLEIPGSQLNLPFSLSGFDGGYYWFGMGMPVFVMTTFVFVLSIAQIPLKRIQIHGGIALLIAAFVNLAVLVEVFSCVSYSNYIATLTPPGGTTPSHPDLFSIGIGFLINALGFILLLIASVTAFRERVIAEK